MRFALSLIAATLISIAVRACSADEIPFLPDAEYFQSTPAPSTVPAVPSPSKPAAKSTAHLQRHPLMEESSLFGGGTRRESLDENSPTDSLFARKPLPPTLGRSLRFHGANAELFPTLRSVSTVRVLPLPAYVGVNPPKNAPPLAMEPSDQPVILQSDFEEFPPLD